MISGLHFFNEKSPWIVSEQNQIKMLLFTSFFFFFFFFTDLNLSTNVSLLLMI